MIQAPLQGVRMCPAPSAVAIELFVIAPEDCNTNVAVSPESPKVFEAETYGILPTTHPEQLTLPVPAATQERTEPFVPSTFPVFPVCEGKSVRIEVVGWKNVGPPAS